MSAEWDLPFDLEPDVPAKIKLKKKSAKSALEEAFDLKLKQFGFPPYTRELRFASPRMFRFDFAWEELKIAVEIEGFVILPGIVAGRRMMIAMGGHASPEGLKRDIEKHNLAVYLGWRVLRFHRDMISSGEAIAELVRMFSREKQVRLPAEPKFTEADYHDKALSNYKPEDQR